MTRLFFAAVLVLSVGLSARGEQPATWHGAEGQLLFSGNVLGVTGDSERVQISIPASALSLADRAFILTFGDSASEFRLTVRQWTSADGKYHVNAKAIWTDGESVHLLRVDNNKVANVPIAKLSNADRSYLDRLQKAIEQPDATADDPFASVEAFTGSAPQRAPPPSAGRTTPAVRPTNAVETADPIVYVTKSGTKYHTAGCRYLSKSSISMPLSEAAGRYSPCSVCHPPIPNEGGAAVNGATPERARVISPPPNPASESVDRNPYGETVTGHTATGIPTFIGPRGGHYHYSKSGKKVYERRNK